MIKKTLQLFFLILVSGLFFFCKSNDIHEKKKDNQLTFIESEITKEVYNQDKSKILILNYVIHRSPVITYNFKVVDSKSKKVLKKGVFVGSKIEWKDNSTLKCFLHKGIVQKENEAFSDRKNSKPNIDYIIIQIR
ncbi:hypothetical protein BTO04_09335 [Polaribacter sp. SA4-10]|uniref:hypothetical protein n=1 Tax=Polaribacter sp. SA4-10 TaxID=754397 RepID=UPI000B3C5BED|nr:hypothetical protein [Polaribacter sp. SA4-10]ARV06872.1 hypothetical protein BTO04_09335 [Polaribacter sp. SA4-10]